MNLDALWRRIMSCDKIVVPDNAAFTGGCRDDFLTVGCSIVSDLIRTTGLTPSSKMLEIGSGLGRIAYPLAFYLEDGHYVGLEIVQDSVAFSARHVTPLSAPGARFDFVHIDIHNEFYNPSAAKRLAEYVFPELGQFDVVFMSSVCTHLNDKELRLYLERAAQWTRYDGDFWATFFLVDRAAERRLLHQKASSSLPFDLSSAGPDYYLDDNRSTVAVAYRVDYVRSLYADYALSIQSLDLGTWSGVNRDYGGYQDLVVAKRI